MTKLARRRLVLVLIGVAALAGAALGLLMTRGGTENALAQAPAGVLARGTFETVSWGTTGTATIERTASGRIVLRLGGDFRTQRAPELAIHVGSTRIPLRSASGAQTYTFAGAGPGTLRATVEIFCEKCNKTWGEAKLAPTRRGRL
jgi:ABC-type enterobactin transport system permease subunit